MSVSDPLLLSGFYCAYEGSFFSNRFQHLYFFINFVLSSVQLTFSILLQVHISKASSLFISSFLMVHVSEPYSITLHISVFIICVFNVLFTFPLRSFLLFKNAAFPIAILLVISLWHLAYVANPVIIL